MLTIYKGADILYKEFGGLTKFRIYSYKNDFKEILKLIHQTYVNKNDQSIMEKSKVNNIIGLTIRSITFKENIIYNGIMKRSLNKYQDNKYSSF
ncbi:unnamed protein product [Paramecium sonneborni]|uniref:Uncharacterized protein n=1 Tax=Paramecium sonneborni TaxID=65129 RepID=A0A8S1NSQ7_9CILI|nr:unnamed protein product [Paramecium sonneborni]